MSIVWSLVTRIGEKRTPYTTLSVGYSIAFQSNFKEKETSTLDPSLPAQLRGIISHDACQASSIKSVFNLRNKPQKSGPTDTPPASPSSGRTDGRTTVVTSVANGASEGGTTIDSTDVAE